MMTALRRVICIRRDGAAAPRQFERPLTQVFGCREKSVFAKTMATFLDWALLIINN